MFEDFPWQGFIRRRTELPLGEAVADIALLKPAERLCLVLCHAEGMSHAEIGATTGWPLGTVKSHVARGAAQLRELLGEEGG